MTIEFDEKTFILKLCLVLCRLHFFQLKTKCLLKWNKQILSKHTKKNVYFLHFDVRMRCDRAIDKKYCCNYLMKKKNFDNYFLITLKYFVVLLIDEHLHKTFIELINNSQNLTFNATYTSIFNEQNLKKFLTKTKFKATLILQLIIKSFRKNTNHDSI